MNQIPNGQTFSCLNCHLTSEGGGAVNVFGESVEGVVGVALVPHLARVELEQPVNRRGGGAHLFTPEPPS